LDKKIKEFISRLDKEAIKKYALQAALVILVCFFAFYWGINMVMSVITHSKVEVIVPDITGMHVAEALDNVSPLGLSLKKEGSEFNAELPAGTVLRQFPAAGTNVKEGKVIRVNVSSGGEVIRVPELEGQTERNAEIALRGAGLTLGAVTRKYSVVAPKDIIMTQSIAAGTVANKGDMINIFVSDGLPPEGVYLMPDWRFKDVNDAQMWAQNEGLTLDVQTIDTDEAKAGEIFNQSPEPDTNLEGIQTVTLFTASESSANTKFEMPFTYTVPEGNTNSRIRLVLVDADGEKDILNAVKKPASIINLTLTPKGKAFVKVFVNNIAVEDIPLN
jgi:serine/threonine-protein kinase